MDSLFPKITHINDVLPAIEGKTEFFVADRGTHKIINYRENFSDTFPPLKVAGGSPKMRAERSLHNKLLRECRGIIFSESGEILRRPFPKFFNIGEKEETKIQNLNFSSYHWLETKLDGSFISPFMLEGKVRFGTKMGITEVSIQAEEFAYSNPRYVEFSKNLIENGITPIFEWTSRQQRIVLDYPEDNLTLLAARYMVSGEFLPL